MSVITIAGYVLLAVAAVLLLVGGIAAARRRRSRAEPVSSDLPPVGAAVTPPERAAAESAAPFEHDERARPPGGPLPVAEPTRADPSPREHVPAFESGAPDTERRRRRLYLGAATVAAGAALAWLLSRGRSKREQPPVR